MSKAQTKRKEQRRLARLEIVSQMYRRGYSMRQIRDEVVKRLDLATCSTGTIYRDIQMLLKEWREARLSQMDDAVELELERINECIRELWEQWEKSKTDYTKTAIRKKGAVRKGDTSGDDSIRTSNIEKTEEVVVRLGDPSYIAEIRQQLQEARKLLGLYAPERKELSGGITVTEFDADAIPDELLLQVAEQLQNSKARKIAQQKDEAKG